MSIWNRIGDFATELGKNAIKFGGEVAKAQAGEVRLAWDIATAPWNDNEEYNGFVNTLRTSWAKEGDSIVKPLASAGGAVMKVPGIKPVAEKIYDINQNYIREPLTTAGLVAGEVARTKSPASFFDPNEWKKAYKGAQSISYGQALVGYVRNWYDPKFNIYDPRERDAAFKQNFWGQTTTGFFDAGAQIFGDVTIVGGKAGAALKAGKFAQGTIKAADVAAQTAEDITKAQYGVKNHFSGMLEDFAKNDSTYALNHPMIKSSSQPGLLAHLLGDAVDVEETGLILRSALGDPMALDELALGRAYMADALKAARADLSAVDEFKLFSAPDGSGMIPFMNDNPAVIKEAMDNYSSLIAHDDYFAKLMQLGEGGGSLTRTTGPLTRGLDNFLAESRSLKFYDKTPGAPKIQVFQPTPFHRLYQKLSWAAGERPAGIVDFNDADSYREIIATIQRSQKIGAITADEGRDILNNYIKAATPEERFVATSAMESRIFRNIAAKWDIDEEMATKIYNAQKNARTSALSAIKDKGFMVDTDGSIIKVPLLESQSANYLPIMDFELMNKLLKQNSSLLNAVTGKAAGTVLHYGDVLQDAFKAGALLRLGYTQRNAVDSQLRIWASVGAMASLQHLGPGMKHLIYNTVKTPARFIDRFRPIDAGMTYAEIQNDTRLLMKELDGLKNEISTLEATAAIRPNDMDLAAKINTLKMLREEKLAVYEHNSGVLAKNTKMTPKQRIATGSYEVRTSDGQVYVLHDAFGGPLGDMFRKIASSQNSMERMVDANGDLYKRMLSSKGIQAIKPTDPAYFDQWAQTLRTQFGNSEVIKQINAGKTNKEIATWLRNSPEGRDLRKRLGLASSEVDEYVTKVNGFYDTYLPATSNLRPKLGEITANDLRTTFKDPSDLPIIHGHLLEENMLNLGPIKGREIVNTLFKFLGTLPEDAMARNPLYVHFYRKEVTRRLNIVSGLRDGERVSVAEQEKIMAAAHKTALREMKGILFNIERKTNLAMAMKYISPFFSAQENAYKTWAKLAVANPAIANRGYIVWQAPNRSGLVTDQDGNPVPVGKTSGNDVIWVSLPKGLTKIPGLNSLTEMGIPKQSLDIIFQGGMDVLYNDGNPNVASDIFPVGPYVGIPASELVKRQPQYEDALKWALPFGPSKNAVSAFLPAWAQRLQTLAAGQDDPAFARSYQLIWNTEQQNAKRDGLPPVPPEKILTMTKQYWLMRTAANVIMPFAPRFDSPYKFYLDKSREYRRTYGINADAKFLADFPDFFTFSSSLSSNPTGVQSSVQAVQNLKKYGTLVSELADIEPKLAGLVVNDFSGYEFSQAAYDYLYSKKISPGGNDTFLSSQSPKAAQKKNDAEKGWIIYNQFSDILDNELKKRGLTSVQEKGAEDLAAIKSVVIQKLSVQTDAQGKPIFDKTTGTYAKTAWYDDYTDSDGSKTNRVIQGLGKILDNKEFIKANKDNPTWKSVKAYMEFRKIIATELMLRPVKSINAKSNADIRLTYDAVVKKLKDDDKLGFAYIYDRFLSQDLVVDKYLTPKAVK